MTRDEALALDKPAAGVPDLHTATGTDGARWFETHQHSRRHDDWTFELLWDGRRFYPVEAETDPPGVAWAPGYLDPPAGSLPVTDPNVEMPRARGRQNPPPGKRPALLPEERPAPCSCAACQRRRGELAH